MLRQLIKRSVRTSLPKPILKPQVRNSSFSIFSTFLSQMNKRKHYKFNPQDYVKLAHPKIGFCEIQGNRDDQEDVLDATESLAGIEKIPSNDIKILYKNTISKIQERHGNEPNQGSTLCSVTAWIDSKKILNSHTAYVGDSSGYLVVLNEKNEVANTVRLNKNLHNPYYGRLILMDPNGFSVFSRQHDMYVLAKGALALQRSIGDTAYEVVGLSHEPEIDEFKVAIPSTHKAYIIVACDGLTEGRLDLKDVGTIVAKNSSNPPDVIAKELVLSAYHHGSNDNISVAVMLVDSEKPIAVSVYDGHGGKKVSQAISKAFYPELQTQIRQYELQKITKNCVGVIDESKEEKQFVRKLRA